MADLSKIRLNGVDYNFKDAAVPAWAKNATKPTYTASEVGATTTTDVNSLIATAIGSINSFEVSIVQSLPTEDIDTHTIYFISNSGSGTNIYDEYMYINSNWEKIGTTETDLSGYLQTGDIADWAKAATKPSYTASEVGAIASTAPAAAITSQDITNWNNKPSTDTNTTYTLSMSSNRITLTPSSGNATYVDLPIYDGSVT